MAFPKVYSFADAREFLVVSKPYFLNIVKQKKIPFQETTASKIFFEPDLVAFQLARFEKAKTDPRIKVTEAQRRRVEEALARQHRDRDA